MLEFPSLPANVAFSRYAVAAFASQLDQFTLVDIEDIRIAVSELVSNVVIHAYPDGPGPVRVEGRLREGCLEITVSDHGRGIANVEQALEPTFTTLPGERMGLGLTFARQLMDEMTVTSAPGQGTVVHLVKRPSAAPVQPPAVSS